MLDFYQNQTCYNTTITAFIMETIHDLHRHQHVIKLIHVMHTRLYTYIRSLYLWLPFHIPV